MVGSLLRHYAFALTATLAVFLAVFMHAGVSALWPVFILAVIEITFSFDNAVLNSEILARMSKIWRTLFLTVGILIAVFGVRLVMPLILVAITTNTGIGAVLDMALHHPDEYAEHLHEGYPVIAAFGGTFLLMIALRFLAEERDVLWIHKIERTVAAIKRPWLFPIAGAALIVALVAVLRPGEVKVLVAAALGAVTFLLLKGMAVWVELRQDTSKATNLGFVGFLYLEVLDASFSFDGVIAAFAITKDIVLISAGLGIGALYVRSITVHLLKRNTLANYRYLVHGAHYAILFLGVVLLLELKVEVPEAVTGLTGVAIISYAIFSSIRHRKDTTPRKLHAAH